MFNLEIELEIEYEGAPSSISSRNVWLKFTASDEPGSPGIPYALEYDDATTQAYPYRLDYYDQFYPSKQALIDDRNARRLAAKNSGLPLSATMPNIILGEDDPSEVNIVKALSWDQPNLNPDPDGDYVSASGVVEALVDTEYSPPYVRIKYEIDWIEAESELDPANHNHSWYLDWKADTEYPMPPTWDEFSPQYTTLMLAESAPDWQTLYPFNETAVFPEFRLDYALKPDYIIDEERTLALNGDTYTTDVSGIYGVTYRYKVRNRNTGALMWEIAFKYVPQLANPIQYYTSDVSYWGSEDGTPGGGEWFHERYIQAVDWDTFEILDTPPVITCSLPSSDQIHTVQRDGVDYYAPIPLITFAKFKQLYHGEKPVSFWEAREGIFQK